MKNKVITFFLIVSIIIFLSITIGTIYIVVKSFIISDGNIIDELDNNKTFIQKIAEENFLQKTMIGFILLFIAITFIIINELRAHLRMKNK